MPGMAVGAKNEAIGFPYFSSMASNICTTSNAKGASDRGRGTEGGETLLAGLLGHQLSLIRSQNSLRSVA